MQDLQGRIQLLISTKGMTNAEFADKIGVHPSIISHISSGRNKPSLDIVNKITEAFKEVRLEWLMKGKGPMTSGSYKLFDDVEVTSGKTEKPKTTGEVVKTSVGGDDKATIQSASVKSLGKVAEIIENEGETRENEQAEKGAKKYEKKYPHKLPPKAIERIVIFYEDKSFREYYPED